MRSSKNPSSSSAKSQRNKKKSAASASQTDPPTQLPPELRSLFEGEVKEGCVEGHLEVVKYLVNQGANLAQTFDKLDANSCCTRALTCLLQAGASIDDVNEDGYTPLMEAASVVKFLLKFGANINALTANTLETPLSVACSSGALDAVHLLLSKGADPELGLRSPVTEAAQEGHIHVVQFLLDMGLSADGDVGHDEDQEDDEEEMGNDDDEDERRNDTPLCVAAENNHIDIIDLLIEKGNAQVDLMDRNTGMSALMRAIQAGKYDATVSLIEHGADVNAVSSSGDHSPLTLAAATGNTAIFEYLLSHGADVGKAVKEDNNVLVEACRHGHFKIAMLTMRELQKFEGTTTVTEQDETLGMNFFEQMARMSSVDQPCPNCSTKVDTSTDAYFAGHLQHQLAAAVRSKANVTDEGPFSALRAHVDSFPVTELKLLAEHQQLAGRWASYLSNCRIDPNNAAAVMAAAVATATATSSSTLHGSDDEDEDEDEEASTTDLDESNEDEPSYFYPPPPPPSSQRRQSSFNTDPKKALEHMRELVVSADGQCSSCSQCRARLARRSNNAVAAAAARRCPCRRRRTPQKPTATSPKPSAKVVNHINTPTASTGDTPLTVACNGGFRDLVLELISKGANIEHRDKRGYTALIIACLNSHKEVVELLIENGAQIEGTCEKTRETPLCVCCSQGRLEIAEYLIKKGANKEHRNTSDYTPLCLAASSGHVDLIRLLVKHGADLNSRASSKLGITPLMLASMNGHVNAVRTLIELGADVNAYVENNRNTALTLACYQGKFEIVKILVEHRAQIDHRSKAGLTPLMEAASGNYVDIGLYLIEHGAEVNLSIPPTSRDTALTIAADRGHDRFVRMLLANNAAVDMKNKRLQTPLWLACSGGYLETAKCLVEYKADPDAEDSRKVSCLSAAFRNGHVDVVSFLVEKVRQFPTVEYMNKYLKTHPLVMKKTMSSGGNSLVGAGHKQQTAEMNRKKLEDNCLKCVEIIVAAKEAQTRAADRNAQELIRSLEEEEKTKQAKKDAAAKKREKRRQKRSKKIIASIHSVNTANAASAPPVQSPKHNQEGLETPVIAPKVEEKKERFSESDNDDGDDDDDSIEKGGWIAVGVGGTCHHKKQTAEPILKLAPAEPKLSIYRQPTITTSTLRPPRYLSRPPADEITKSVREQSADRKTPAINDKAVFPDLKPVMAEERATRPSRPTASTWFNSNLLKSKSVTTRNRPTLITMTPPSIPKPAAITVKSPLPKLQTPPKPAPPAAAAVTTAPPTSTKVPVSITTVHVRPRNEEPPEQESVPEPVSISDLAFAGPVLCEADMAKAPGYNRHCQKRQQQSVRPVTVYLEANSNTQQPTTTEDAGSSIVPTNQYHHLHHHHHYHHVPQEGPQTRLSPRLTRPTAPRPMIAPSSTTTNEPSYLQYIRRLVPGFRKTDSDVMMAAAAAAAAAVATSAAQDSSGRLGANGASSILDEFNGIFRSENFSNASGSSTATRIEEFFNRNCFSNLEPNTQATAAAAAAAAAAAYNAIIGTTSAAAAAAAGNAVLPPYLEQNEFNSPSTSNYAAVAMPPADLHRYFLDLLNSSDDAHLTNNVAEYADQTAVVSPVSTLTATTSTTVTHDRPSRPYWNDDFQRQYY